MNWGIKKVSILSMNLCVAINVPINGINPAVRWTEQQRVSDKGPLYMTDHGPCIEMRDREECFLSDRELRRMVERR